MLGINAPERTSLDVTHEEEEAVGGKSMWEGVKGMEREGCGE